MGLKETIAQLIADEIANDPSGVGYAGKTEDEIAVLLNSGITRTVTNFVTEQPPISRILNGIGFAPNVCATTDVAEAKTMTPVIRVIEGDII